MGTGQFTIRTLYDFSTLEEFPWAGTILRETEPYYSIFIMFLERFRNVTWQCRPIHEINNLTKVFFLNDFSSLKRIDLELVDFDHKYPDASDPSHPLRFHMTAPYTVHELVLATVIKDVKGSDDDYDIKGLGIYCWTATLVSLLMMAIISTKLKAMVPNRKDRRDWLWSFYENIWFFLANLLQNDPGHKVKRMHIKFFLSGWIIASCILSKVYSGSMHGNLIIDKSTFIDAFDDILKHPEMRYIPTSACYSILKERQNERFWMKVVKQSLDIEDSTVQTWENGKVPWCIHYFSIKQQIHVWLNAEHDVGSVYIGRKFYFPEYGHMYLSRRLPISIVVHASFLVQRYFETSLSHFYHLLVEARLRNNVLDPLQTNIASESAMSVRFLKKVFYLWCCGLAFSIVTFVVEIGHIVESKKSGLQVLIV